MREAAARRRRDPGLERRLGRADGPLPTATSTCSRRRRSSSGSRTRSRRRSADEWLYARGVADDKGQLWMLLHAAGLLAADGALPVNLRVVSDGEEEVGGQSIVEFLGQDERGADCVRHLRRQHGAARACRPSRSRRAASPHSTSVSARASATSTRACTGTPRMNAIHALIDDARRHPAARRPRAGGAADRHRARHRRGARGLGAAAGRDRGAPRRRGAFPTTPRRPRSSTSARRPSPRSR